MSNHDVEIATIIRDQIGSRALYMLGAQSFVAVENGLQFKVRGSRQANTVRITLDGGSDLYHVEVMKVTMTRDYDMRVKHTVDISGAGADQLCVLIEKGTGLYTKLF